MSNLDKVITNTFTNKQTVRSKPGNDEVDLCDESVLLVETDTKGIITYANRRFCKVIGYRKEALRGMPFSFTYHPDMPAGLFLTMWKIVSEKKVWRGYVKSLCKDGKYFWSLMYMQAKVDENDKIIGYAITSKKAYESPLIEAEQKYKELQGLQYANHNYFMRLELFHGEQLATRA